MVIILLSSTIAGATLGYLFRWYILFPTTSLVLVFTIVQGLIARHDSISIVVTATSAAVFVQIGYLVGLAFTKYIRHRALDAADSGRLSSFREQKRMHLTR
jgi:hypothetical protein